jgi:hypothetical protein
MFQTNNQCWDSDEDLGIAVAVVGMLVHMQEGWYLSHLSQQHITIICCPLFCPPGYEKVLSGYVF